MKFIENNIFSSDTKSSLLRKIPIEGSGEYFYFINNGSTVQCIYCSPLLNIEGQRSERKYAVVEVAGNIYTEMPCIIRECKRFITEWCVERNINNKLLRNKKAEILSVLERSITTCIDSIVFQGWDSMYIDCYENQWVFEGDVNDLEKLVCPALREAERVALILDVKEEKTLQGIIEHSDIVLTTKPIHFEGKRNFWGGSLLSSSRKKVKSRDKKVAILKDKLAEVVLADVSEEKDYKLKWDGAYKIIGLINRCTSFSFDFEDSAKFSMTKIKLIFDMSFENNITELFYHKKNESDIFHVVIDGLCLQLSPHFSVVKGEQYEELTIDLYRTIENLFFLVIESGLSLLKFNIDYEGKYE